MSKATRVRQENARAKIAAQQAAARRSQMRRNVLLAGGSIIAVIAVVVALVLVKTLNHSTPPKAAAAASNAAVANKITNVPGSVADSVGAGPAGKVSPLTPITSPALTLNGKPEVLYVGAEYCPYCAAERWAMVTALSRFGTFSGLHFIHSSSTDYYAGTATLTFYKSSYTSKYLTFVPVETQTVTGQTLQQATSAQLALLNKYGGGSFPFVDVGGKYVVSGAQYLPSVLGTVYGPGSVSPTALTWSQIAQDLQGNNAVSQNVLGAANHITAAICKITNGQPGNVCNSAAVTAVGGSI